jgi:hypothetical protein
MNCMFTDREGNRAIGYALAEGFGHVDKLHR